MTIYEIKRSVTFFPEKRKGANGEIVAKNAPIRMSVTFHGKRVQFYSGHRIDFNKWDERRQRAKNNTTHENGVTHIDINQRLDRLNSGIQSFFKACEVKGYVPSLTEVKEEFQRISRNQLRAEDTFFGAFDTFVKVVGKQNEWDQDTYTKFGVIKNHLTSFDENLTFEALDGGRLLDYITHLREKRKMRNTTIKKSLSFVRWFLKWAEKNNKPVNPTALTFQAKLKGTDSSHKKVIFLNIEELKHLFALDLTRHPSYLPKVRDVFVFCCFTGLRYSDAFNLKKVNDRGDHIEFVAQKTSDFLKVQLNKYSREILDRYKDVPFPDGKALPVMSNQKMNDYLKELGQVAEFNSPETIVYFKGNERIEETMPKHALLTTHCARKTFVTNLIYLGVSDHVIKQWTGHRDNKSFEVYHKMVDEIKSREMAKFDSI